MIILIGKFWVARYGMRVGLAVKIPIGIVTLTAYAE